MEFFLLATTCKTIKNCWRLVGRLWCECVAIFSNWGNCTKTCEREISFLQCPRCRKFMWWHCMLSCYGSRFKRLTEIDRTCSQADVYFFIVLSVCLCTSWSHWPYALCSVIYAIMWRLSLTFENVYVHKTHVDIYCQCVSPTFARRPLHARNYQSFIAQ